MLSAGKMDRRITLQRKTSAQDGFGEPIETWAAVDTVWAEATPLSGKELWQAQQINAEVDTRFRIRYLAGFSPVDRIVYDGKNYDVYSVIEMGRREGLEIMASSKVA